MLRLQIFSLRFDSSIILKTLVKTKSQYRHVLYTFLTNILKKKIKMRRLKHNSLLKLVNSYLIDAPQPTNISYN